ELAFDAALAELEQTVAELEAGGLALERTLALYERGVALQQRCERLLGEHEEVALGQGADVAGTLDVRKDDQR
ncbi:MAG TPA: exodeoxyribonuclease VII small subunit, partial [Candidatus Nanopelagicales bacterium]|nr:exodeoxyribonuclease VII small subunit [Candidatus Nanopelagicales bacterium]